MVDSGIILQSAVTLAGFLIGVNAFLPKGLEEEWFAYAMFLVPSPVLFMIDSILAAYNLDIALPLFSASIVVLMILFVGLGIWSSWEKYAEHQLKYRIKTRKPAFFHLLSQAS